MVVSRRARLRIGTKAFPTAASTPANARSRSGDEVQLQLQHHAMVRGHPATQRLDQLGSFAPRCPLRQIGQAASSADL
jgi:hypothetical protein